MDPALVGDVSKRRIFATGLDGVAAGFVALLTGSGLPEEMSTLWRTLAAALVYLMVFFFQEGAFASTLGKRLFGLAVYRLDGSLAGWKEAAIRTVFRIFEVNPILGAIPGGIVILCTKRRQRFGDWVAGTVVMRRREVREAAGGREPGGAVAT